MTGRRRKPSPPHDQQLISTRDISAGVDAFISYQQKEKTASTKAKVSMKTVSQGMMDVSPDVKRFPAPDGTPTPQIRLLLAPGQSYPSLHGSTDRSEGPHVVVRLPERLRH
eukprot:XP_011424863.1 PREDICTED: uncharacterized protein LOC105326493 isoform X2 [Crassostrea gigas]